MRRPFLLVPLLSCSLTGCGVDSVGANGELGRLVFGLTSDWYLDPTNLTEVGIVTGHPQSFICELSDRGSGDIGESAEALLFSVTPDDGGDVTQLSLGDEEVPSLRLTVTVPGDYTIAAALEGEIFDFIQLRFDAPSGLEIAAYTRAPYAEEFEPLGLEDVHPVAEGTQLAWLPIPLDAAGERLAGQLESTVAAEPAELVVPVANVQYVNENDVSDITIAPSLYFIEAGAVTVTVTDTVTPASGVLDFAVEAVVPEA